MIVTDIVPTPVVLVKVSVYLTDAERAAVRAAAKTAGVSVSAYLRGLALAALPDV